MRRKRMRRHKNSNKLFKLNIGLILVFLFSTVIMNAGVMAINFEVEKLNRQIGTQANRNQSLSMKVNELTSPEHVQLVAQELGLMYNNSNIVTLTE